MLRLYFEKEIVKLTQDVEQIWSSVLQQLKRVIEVSSKEDFQEIIEKDTSINEAVMHLDEKCQEVICLQHPVGSDLRRIITIMKLATDIERMGDRIAGVASSYQEASITKDWQPLFDEIAVLQLAVRDQIKKAYHYYQHIQQKEIRLEVDPRRKEIMSFYHSLEERVVTLLSKEGGDVELGIQALDILQHLDKISNLVLNLYKWMSYQQTGRIE